jgi:hypothetical protein
MDMERVFVAESFHSSMSLGLDEPAFNAHSRADKGVMTLRLSRKRVAIAF